MECCRRPTPRQAVRVSTSAVERVTARSIAGPERDRGDIRIVQEPQYFGFGLLQLRRQGRCHRPVRSPVAETVTFNPQLHIQAMKMR
jgi:hypothetical protein